MFKRNVIPLEIKKGDYVVAYSGHGDVMVETKGIAGGKADMYGNVLAPLGGTLVDHNTYLIHIIERPAPTYESKHNLDRSKKYKVTGLLNNERVPYIIIYDYYYKQWTYGAHNKDFRFITTMLESVTAPVEASIVDLMDTTKTYVMSYKTAPNHPYYMAYHDNAWRMGSTLDSMPLLAEDHVPRLVESGQYTVPQVREASESVEHGIYVVVGQDLNKRLIYRVSPSVIEVTDEQGTWIDSLHDAETFSAIIRKGIAKKI